MGTNGGRLLEQGAHPFRGLAVWLCGFALGGVELAERRHEHRDALAVDTPDGTLAPVAAVCEDGPDRLADPGALECSRGLNGVRSLELAQIPSQPNDIVVL